MSVVALVSPNPLRSRIFPSPCLRRFRSPAPALSLPINGPIHRRSFIFPPSGGSSRSRPETRASSGGADRGEEGEVSLSVDAFLSAAEILCVAPSLVFASGSAVGYLLPKGTPKLFHVTSGNAFFVGQFLLLVVAVVIGVLIRNRQARGVSTPTGGPGDDLVGRIEKVEEDVRNSSTVLRGLSRHLEKLGTRFRVTRRTLKDPISETAELAKRNSEATRVLALQAEILQKELMQIQEVLLVMQDQQQKQLDIILAIGKAGMPNKSDRKVSSKQDAAGKTDPVSEKKELQEVEVLIGKNDKP